jgi:hypothetical protein
VDGGKEDPGKILKVTRHLLEKLGVNLEIHRRGIPRTQPDDLNF